MYKEVIFEETTVNTNECEVGEPLEDRIARIMDEKSPIEDEAPLIYNAGNEINPDYDIRTDHMELAQDKAEARLKQRREFLKKTGTGKEKEEAKPTETEPIEVKKGGETTT